MAQRTDDDDSRFDTKRMANAYYWAAQADGWLDDGPNTFSREHYYVEVMAGTPIIVLDGDFFNDSTLNALVEGLRHYDFPTISEVRDLTEKYGEYRIFLEPSDDRLKSRYMNDWREFENGEFAD